MRSAPIALAVLALAGCGDKDADSTADTQSGQAECHPNVPEDKCALWQFEGCNDGEDTQVYKLAEGRTDADGKITLTETWYWFMDDESWDSDCIDVIEYEGTRLSAANLQALNAGEAEEGYAVRMTKSTDGCPGQNYYYLWDHPDKDDFEYGDGLDQDAVLIFDTLNPNGNLNFENAMLVFVGYDVGDGYRMSYDYARGVFTPDSMDDLGPPATYTWETEACLESADPAP